MKIEDFKKYLKDAYNIGNRGIPEDDFDDMTNEMLDKMDVL